MDEGAELGGDYRHAAGRDGLAAQPAHGALGHLVQHVGHVQGHVVTGRHKCVVTHLED